MTRLDLVDYSTQSVLNVSRIFKTISSRKEHFFLNENSVEKKCINREFNSLELTI